MGSNLALRLKECYVDTEVVALDNLRRRGAELALARLSAGGVRYLHGDVRIPGDLKAAGDVDLILDCAAEPSVLAGLDGSPEYVVDSNLGGTLHCLELARQCGAALIFLSTSRVYPVAPVNGLVFRETETRYVPDEQVFPAGASGAGISEEFSLAGVRSIYGATKLGSELFIQEYAAAYGLKAVINRCGVLTGPWQMGKVDQGVVALWVARHLYRQGLAYIGFGGSGKQVRDILHVDDLFDLLCVEIEHLDVHSGQIYNVGGGAAVSLSLCELTALCQRHTGVTVSVRHDGQTRPNDLIWYVSDCHKVEAATGWRPRRGAEETVADVARWVRDHQVLLEPFLGR